MESALMQRPARNICPALGFNTPVRRLINVLLPAPFGPINACLAPSATLRLIAFETRNLPNSLQRSRVSRARMLIAAIPDPFGYAPRRGGGCRPRRRGPPERQPSAAIRA